MFERQDMSRVIRRRYSVGVGEGGQKGCPLTDPVQGMQLLVALPQKWDNVSMVCLQGKTQLTQVTFAGVQDTIMVVVDSMTKGSHFISTVTTLTTDGTAQLYL